ncbi:hypothetical protein Rwratislav_31860 [Rhodococcus wratislaviensis IFP 2016]|nr:hypothetical protein Rwratislav_31860 [Rhodococcus wratislaviensis IFP 2016]
MERRRADPDTALGYLEGLPALVLLERLPVPVLAVDRDGHIVHVNRAFEAMMGYPHDALSGRSIRDLLPPASPPRPVAEDLQQSAGTIVTLTHRDGSAVRAAISKSVLTRADDPVLLVCFHDVTEQLWDGGHAPNFG